MEYLQVLLLALIQGVTEFLPISSSGHLLLPAYFLGWADQGLIFDVAVHLGTLIAVVLYFRKVLVNISINWLRSLIGKGSTDNSRLGWYLIIASIPAAVVGLCIKKAGWDDNLRSIAVIASTTLVFGIVLGIADFVGRKEYSLVRMTFWQALIIGCCQALALIPGTSRSGITITAALFMGFTRETGAYFSFLLSIPVILGAGILLLADVWMFVETVDWQALFVGVTVSGISAWICIYIFLEFINRIGYIPFVFYRIVLGFFLFFSI